MGIVFIFPSVSGLSQWPSRRFHNSEMCQENKEQKAFWELLKMDKLTMNFDPGLMNNYFSGALWSPLSCYTTSSIVIIMDVLICKCN